MTLIEKFKSNGNGAFPVISEDDNIIVMTDESHRSQYKTFAMNMRKALPNATFIGFTGTPIDKKERSTTGTFGAYIDRVPFVSDMVNLPAKIIVNPDTFNLVLNGKINNSEPASLKFRIFGYAPATYSDLVSLNGKSYNLKDNSCLVELTEAGNVTPLKIISGELKFVRAQKLFVDKELVKTILSGTFHIQTFRKNEPITISGGRFDLGFGTENFYNF